MTKPAPLLLAFFCLIVTELSAQEIKLKKGQQFIVESKQSIIFNTDTTYSTNIYSFDVKGKNPSGNYLLGAKLIAARQKSISKGRTVSFDTDSIHKAKFNTTALLEKLAVLHRPFSVTLSPKGKIVEVKGVQKLVKNSVKKWKLDKETADGCIHNTSRYPSTIQALFFRLPTNKKMKKGLEWGGGTQKDETYRIIQTSKDHVLIHSKSSNYTLDKKTLLPLLLELSSLDTASGARVTRKIIRLSEYDTAKIDTAWLNMAIACSHWSDKLKNNAEYDSLKVAGFIEKYERIYADDPLYLSRTLVLLQWTNAYDEYNKHLQATPNSFLINESSHLHNKLQRIHESDARAAFDIVRILDQHHPKSLYEWIQDSFSQSFIGNDEDAERKEAYKLLDMCMNDPDESLRQQFTPLNLWVNTKMHKGEKAMVQKATSDILQMDEFYWKDCNLGRYALLTYKLLVDNNDAARAGKLLDQVLIHLGEAANDSLNVHRPAHRNMLAYAYYLKSRNVLSTDSVSALEYLKTAASYSPKSSAERASGSFYDRVFLKSKKSYREDYMQALSKMGKTKEALAAMIVEFNANPYVLPELKAFYQNSFPDNDFKTFFVNEVVGKWAEAPSFTLPNLNDKSVSLKNYTGKWLVVDFWGTWCGPCKKEMPQVSKFYQKTKTGSLPGVSFLSIACYDTKQKVIDYFNFNNFDLPAVFSDGKVQKTYKIRGYPTKILISPNGKMKMLRFGAKWEAIIEQLSQAYPGKTELNI